MRLILLTPPGGNTEWRTRLAGAMGWPIALDPTAIDAPAAAKALSRLALLNNETLSALQSTWYHVDNIPLGDDAPKLPRSLSDRIEACANDLNDAPSWLCDDPAMSVLLPYWRGLLEKPLYLVYVEHPVRVGRRLGDAWRFPVSFGVSLWEYYVRAALLHTRDRDRVIVVGGSVENDSDNMLREVVEQLGSFSVKEHPAGTIIADAARRRSATPSDGEPEQPAFLHESQSAFYRALCAGTIEDAGIGVLSAESTDILRMYGRLRAGFDLVRQDRDALRRQLANEPLPAGANAKCAAAGAPEGRASGVVEDTDIVDITVFLRDMEPLELSCARDNPVLAQLLQGVARAGDPHFAGELFFLDMDDTRIYFPLSQLLAVETDGEIADVGSPAPATVPGVETDGRAAPEPGGPNNRKSVAVLVLGCLLPQYERCLDIIRDTWASKRVADIDVYYAIGAHLDPTTVNAEGIRKYFGNELPVLNAFESTSIGNVIACGCADSIALQRDCLLRKRLIAFGHLAAAGRYDYVYTVCASSYVDLAGLRAYVDTLEGDLLLHGPVGVCEFTGRPYVSGASMLFSMDLVKRLLEDTFRIIEDNDGRYADDVALGSWIARHVSDTDEEQIVANVRAGRRATGDNTFVMPKRPAMIDYVSVDTSRQVRVDGAHHYHFRTDSIEQMAAFHRRYFE